MSTSTTSDLVGTQVLPASSTPRWIAALGGSPRRRLAVSAAGLLFLLALTRIITDADQLTASSTIGLTLRLAAPILMAGLAALWAERSGIVNIGIEGMMILGTWFGAYGAWYGPELIGKIGLGTPPDWTAPWIGFVFGVLGGMLGGLIHALATVRFNVDHVISGVAMNLLAFGGMRYLSELAFVGEEGGGISQSPKQVGSFPKFNVPVLGGGEIFGWKSPDVLGSIENHHWFVVSDVAGVLRGFVIDMSWATVICFSFVAISVYVLWRTRFGLRLRSSGEDPGAAESLGVRIVRLRYAGMLASGGFAGLGGAYLSIVSSSYYRQGQTANRGFIGIATTIFGNWRPTGVLSGALLFGFSDAIKLLSPESLTALFLFATFVAGLAAIAALYRNKLVRGVTAAVVAALFLLVYLTVDEVPDSLTQAAPYLITLVVLATASQRLRPPAFAGRPWRPGDSH